MSRLGKRPIAIPEKTEVTVADNSVTVKGPLGELKMAYNPVIEIKLEDGNVVLVPTKESIQANALWGTYSSIIRSMTEGVNKEFETILIFEGVGFKAAVEGKDVVLNVGFSHSVKLEIPEGVKAEVVKDKINITGIDKQAVNQFAAVIRATKKPEPYKGKGIRYSDEIVRRKEGKKTV